MMVVLSARWPVIIITLEHNICSMYILFECVFVYICSTGVILYIDGW